MLKIATYEGVICFSNPYSFSLSHFSLPMLRDCQINYWKLAPVEVLNANWRELN